MLYNAFFGQCDLLKVSWKKKPLGIDKCRTHVSKHEKDCVSLNWLEQVYLTLSILNFGFGDP